MGYQSQLVVRTRAPRGIEVIDQIKELADEEGTTYSKKALEILEAGLSAMEGGEPTRLAERSEPVRSPEAPAPTSKPSDLEASSTPTASTADASPDVVVQRCMEELETRGPRQAARLLADFFAAAGPVEGGRVRTDIKNRVASDTYDELFHELNQTDAYRSYKDRVLSSTG